MKSRKAMVHLEILSDVPINKLKEKDRWVWRKDETGPGVVFVQQITAQVVKEKK